jgi:hypothetical protein
LQVTVQGYLKWPSLLLCNCMIIGAHVIIYSRDADADRAFLRDILELGSVDVGGGWLIFGLPPSEVAVHPAGNNDLQELYLMCDDVEAFICDMLAHDIPAARWSIRAGASRHR